LDLLPDSRGQIVFVKFVFSHAEYDAIDALTVPSFNDCNHANPPDPHGQPKVVEA
jgi:hypothetical protein